MPPLRGQVGEPKHRLASNGNLARGALYQTDIVVNHPELGVREVASNLSTEKAERLKLAGNSTTVKASKSM